MTDTNLLLLITIVVFFAMYIGAILFQGKGFLKPQTFFNILNANASLIILSCGMSLVMITGGIDISVGGVTALVSMCCAVYLDYHNGNVFVAVLIALAIGLACGLVQGFLVAYLDIQPFIVTLAGMFFARGMTTIVNTNPFNVQNEAFVALKETRVIVPGFGSVNKLGKYVPAYIEIGVVVAILIVIVLFCVLRWTKLGRSFYAIGGNEQSAVMMGLNVKATKMKAYVLDGFLAGLGGFLFCLNSCAGFVEQAKGLEMDAIAAAVIGGTLLSGGVGTVIGTVFGVLIKGTIASLITTQGTLSSWWVRIVLSIMLCFFIVLQAIIGGASLRQKTVKKLKGLKEVNT